MRRLLAISCFALLTLAGCRPLFRAPALEPKKPVDDATVARTMNLDLVSDLGRKTIAFEVHWVEGYRPTEFALDGLREAILRFAPEKPVTIEVDETPIPRSEWDASPEGEAGAEAWVERHLRGTPSDSPVAIQIHYVPSGRKWFDMGFFGMAGGAAVELSDGTFAHVPVIYMASQTIVDNSILWLAPKRGERSTLIHEFGHMLGLSRVPNHAQRDDPNHCTEPQCVMAPPRTRNILYNVPRGFFTGTIPTWYCKKCMGDLRAARAWATARARDGADPLARSKDRDRVDVARAEIAALLRRGRDSEAKARLESLLREVPWADDYYELAHAVWGHGWLAEAERTFLQYEGGASTGSARTARQYRLEAVGCQGRYEEVLADLDRSDVPFLRVEVLQALGRPDAAVDAARALLAEIPPEHASWGRLRLAEALREAGREEEALEEIRRAEDGDKAPLRLLAEKGETLLAAGRREEADMTFREIVDLRDRASKRHRASYDVRIPTARAQAHLGNREAAIDVLCAAKPCRPGGWMRTEFARLFVILGDQPAAMDALLQARKEGGVGRLNPCLDPDLRVLRSDPRFAENFPCAPKPAK